MTTKAKKTTKSAKATKTKKSTSSSSFNLPITNIILIFIGIIVVALSFTLRSESAVLRGEIEESVIQASENEVNPANEGKLIVVSGKIFGDSLQKDSTFGISKETVKLKRVVETRQWIKNCEDGNCDYVPIWSEEKISSDEYDEMHQNVIKHQYESAEFARESISLGAYKLSEKLANDLSYDTVMGPDEIAGKYAGDYNLVGEYITNASDINNPKIGDFRISFAYVKDKDVTVIARQTDGAFSAYRTKGKHEVYELKENVTSADEYIQGMGTESNPMSTVALILGIAFVFFGLSASVFSLIKHQA